MAEHDERTSKNCQDCLVNETPIPLFDYDDEEFDDNEPRPTNWWHCQVCDTHIDRYRGEGDQTCPGCGAQYNVSGQRLRDNWRENPSVYDEDIDDLTGFELSQIAHEGV